MEWLLYERKRKRGRTRIRWEDEIGNMVGITWEREVQGRAV